MPGQFFVHSADVVRRGGMDDTAGYVRFGRLRPHDVVVIHVRIVGKGSSVVVVELFQRRQRDGIVVLFFLPARSIVAADGAERSMGEQTVTACDVNVMGGAAGTFRDHTSVSMNQSHQGGYWDSGAAGTWAVAVY